MDQQSDSRRDTAELPTPYVDIRTALPEFYGDVFRHQAQTVLEAEFWTAFGGTEQREYSPEQQLLLTILVQAFADVAAHTGVPLRATGRHKHYSDEGRWPSDAYRWFTELDYLTSDGQKERGISLEAVCDGLDLDISVIRKLALEKWNGDKEA